MLPRRLRLPRHSFAEFPPLRRESSRHFLATIHPGDGRGGCAVVISKKVARLAVARHLLKRRVLSVLRPWCTKEYGLILYARAGSAQLPFPVLSAEVADLARRLITA